MVECRDWTVNMSCVNVSIVARSVSLAVSSSRDVFQLKDHVIAVERAVSRLGGGWEGVGR